MQLAAVAGEDTPPLATTGHAHNVCPVRNNCLSVCVCVQVGCKVGFVFFNYFIMANFFWLLVEGLYLHALLLLTHTCCSRLAIYILIGWGRHTHTHRVTTHTLQP